MAEPSTRPGPGPRQLAAVVVIAVVAAASLAIALRSSSDSGDTGSGVGSSSPGPASASTADQTQLDAAAIDVLAAQDRALRGHDRSGYASTWDDRGSVAQEAGWVFDNVTKLGAADLSTRYIGANVGGLSSSELQPLGHGAWTADVEVTWPLGSASSSPIRSMLVYTFTPRDGRVRVADIATAPGDRTPIWLLGPLDVRRADRTLVAATGSSRAARADRLLRHAVHDVQRVVPDWNGDLLGFAPATREQFDALISAAPHGYEGIAAVTTTVDGSRDPQAPVAIILNPDVFEGLGPAGAQVVVSHEATHAATGATTVTMPLWVAEGFADYVGVGAVDVPLRVSAGAAIRDIRSFGLPDRLPSNSAFQSRDGVEATYEEAWLAFRLMGQEYGQDRVVAFYENVVRRPRAVASALRSQLGISVDQLTHDWRAYLRQVAHGAG